MQKFHTQAAVALSSGEFGIQRDLCVENLGNRAVLLGLAGHFRKCRRIQIRHVGAQRQGRSRDTKSLSLRFEADGRFGAQLGRRESCALQLEGERHRKASGMRGRDKLLRIRAFLIFKAGSERIGCVGEHP